MDNLRDLINGCVRREEDLADVIQVAHVKFELYGWMIEQVQREHMEA